MTTYELSTGEITDDIRAEMDTLIIPPGTITVQQGVTIDLTCTHLQVDGPLDIYADDGALVIRVVSKGRTQ